jgi:hypothetical protein
VLVHNLQDVDEDVIPESRLVVEDDLIRVDEEWRSPGRDHLRLQDVENLLHKNEIGMDTSSNNHKATQISLRKSGCHQPHVRTC